MFLKSGKEYTKIAPGESVRCMTILDYDGTTADSIQVTIMDLYHQAEEKIELDIAAADLPIIFVE